MFAEVSVGREKEETGGLMRERFEIRNKKFNPFDWWQSERVRKPLAATVQLQCKKPQQQQKRKP